MMENQGREYVLTDFSSRHFVVASAYALLVNGRIQDAQSVLFSHNQLWRAVRRRMLR